MNDLSSVRRVRRFEILLKDRTIETVPQPRLRTLIRNGTVTPMTEVREAGNEGWVLAGDLDELRGDLDVAATSRAASGGEVVESISRRRLVLTMALAGLVAGGVLMVLAPLCMLIGVFPKFVLSWAAFGAVLAFGVTSAAKVHDARVIQVTAAGFAAGGMLAWFFSTATGDFTALHLAIIGLVGGAALAYAIHLPLQRAVIVSVAATVLFPIAVLAIRVFTPSRIALPGGILNVIVLPLVLFIPVIPFAAFGGIIGSLMDWSGGEQTE